MPTAKMLLLALLAVAAGTFAAGWAYYLKRPGDWRLPGPYLLGVGFVTNFFDTLGIGSFATTTTLYRLKGVVADENIPGTLNVGHCLPTVAQALIYLTIIEVEQRTLAWLVLAAVAGAWLGAGIVTRLSKVKIQVSMATGLLIAAAFMSAKMFNLFPAGGDGLALHGLKLAVGVAGTFVLGALMTIGIGAYAPIMIMVSLLGMNAKAAFPIMMGSCAFLTCVGSLKFVQADKYDRSAALGLTLGGVPAVLCAAYLVKELPLEVVRVLVIVVVVYTATTIFATARRREKSVTQPQTAA